MYPWGLECKETKDGDEMLRVASKATKSLKKVHGTRFAVGSICKTIYAASGSSVDWGYAKADVKYPYAIELRDTGKYGFLLPPKFIIPSGEEMTEAIFSMSYAILEKL
jgi:murein tripeptide amidase MpaA